jgi:DNA adenine methylase
MSVNKVISYPGAKWKAWNQIEPIIPKDIEDWREPFLGGASMSLSVADSNKFRLKRMLVGDLAPEIWAFWYGAREAADEAIKVATEWFTASCPAQIQLSEMMKDDTSYQSVYDTSIAQGLAFWKWATTVDCTQLSLEQRCARTFLVNRMSFSGMGDSGSMSKERYTDFRLYQLARIKEAQPLLKKMEIINASFEETMADVDPEKTFIFLDPPYYTQEKSGLYGRGGDTHKGFPHEHFAEFTKSMKCRWLVTYDDSIFVRRAFSGCEMRPFKIAYTMAMRNAEDSLAGEELFIANYDISDKSSVDDLDLL